MEHIPKIGYISLVISDTNELKSKMKEIHLKKVDSTNWVSYANAPLTIYHNFQLTNALMYQTKCPQAAADVIVPD